MLEGLRYEKGSFTKSLPLVAHPDWQNHERRCDATSTQLARSAYEVQGLGHSSRGNSLFDSPIDISFQIYSRLPKTLGAGRHDELIHTP